MRAGLAPLRGVLAEAPKTLSTLSRQTIPAGEPKRIADAVDTARPNPPWLDGVHQRLLRRIEEVGVRLRKSGDAALAEAAQLVRVPPVEIPEERHTNDVDAAQRRSGRVLPVHGGVLARAPSDGRAPTCKALLAPTGIRPSDELTGSPIRGNRRR
jgi:hypothetical protein